MLFGNRLKLRYAIGTLVLFSVAMTAFFSWYSAMNAMRDSLTEKYLESNYNYAKKLSLSSSDVLSHMKQNLVAISKVLGKSSYNQADLDAWRAANNSYFNSIFITDTNGVIQLISPEVIHSKEGYEVKAQDKIVSEALQQALEQRVPLISEPYNALTGKRILLISAPVFDQSGQYQGLVGGTIYLESDNVIKNLMNNHQYNDGSYVYVVDRKGRIIFHPNENRMNDDVVDNKIVQKVISGENGSEQIINTEGKEFYAGYAHEENSGWGIVSQTPISVIDRPLQILLQNMVIQNLPLLLLILLLAAYLTNSLTRPINKLARYSEEAIQNKKIGPIKHIKTNIYEVHHLYQHFNDYLNLLKKQIQIDGLTGIFNRKTLDSIMREWMENKAPFSIILLDIDRFKRVNDTYGHLVGDDVLKYLAEMICNSSNGNEWMCFRYGGEEFVILMKNKNETAAFEIAENIRNNIAETTSPTGAPITISLGISSFLKDDSHPENIIRRADLALYQSKTTGRNRTTIYHHDIPCDT